MNPQFKQNVDWNRGDLLYGISYARGVYLKTNFPQLAHMHGHKYWSYIDDYNNRYFCVEMTQNLDPAHVDDMIEALEAQSGATKRHQKYIDVLSRHKYSPRNTLKMNPVNVLRKEGLHTVVFQLTRQIKQTGDPQGARAQALRKKIRDTIKLAYERKAIRRGCKFGIQMVAMNLNSECPNAKIHFLLDGMDMQAVINKADKPETHEATGIQYRNIYITNTELRSVCRYWSKFDKSKILFYLNGKSVGPPWENAWKNQVDCATQAMKKRRTNDPSWWAPLTGGKGTLAKPKPARGRQPIKVDKFQRVRQQWENRIRKHS